MSLGNKLSIVALAATLGGLIVPAFAQSGPSDMQGAPNQGMRMGQMSQGTMQGRMMSRGMMAGGCSEMMQSMNNHDGRPNSQWQKHSPGGSGDGG
jgi:hypothetical protein